MKAFYVWLAVGVVCACSSSTTPDDGGTDASSDVSVKDAANDVTQKDSSTTDSSTTDSSTGDAGDAGDASSGLFTLTINDYLSWCNVSVNGNDAGSSPPTYQFAPDASVALHGDTAGGSFYWGYWQAPTLADGGKDLSMDVSITMNGNVTVLACCPVKNTALSCP